MAATTSDDSFKDILLRGDPGAAREALGARSRGLPPLELVETVVVPALEAIGRDWEEGALALSQVYVAGRMAERLVDELLPPAHPQRKSQPRLAAAVLEDYHALGKRLVIAALRASGYEVADYGHGLKVEDLARRAAADGVEILLVSCLMLASALKVKALRRELEAAGSRARLVVGGAPFRLEPGLWREVGADAGGNTAADVLGVVAAMEEVRP